MQSFQENVAKLDAGDTQVLGVSMDRYGFFAEDNREIFDICSDLYLFIGMPSPEVLSVHEAPYNAAFITLKMSQWHGLTMQSNFTYGKALGTGSEVQATSQFTVPDAYNLHAAYGLQPWDRKFLWNACLVYEPSFYKNQLGLLGHIAGGWSFAPIITVGSGLPLEVQPTDAFANEIYGDGQSFGEGDGRNFAALQNAILICPNNFGSSRHNNPVPSKLGLGSNFFGPSMFQNPDYSYTCFRNPILGIDGSKRCRDSARHALLERGLQR